MSFSQKITQHQEVQNLRWQVIELMDRGIMYWRTVEKLRNMIACLLSEHADGETDNFWSQKMCFSEHCMVVSATEEDEHALQLFI